MVDTSRWIIAVLRMAWSQKVAPHIDHDESGEDHRRQRILCDPGLVDIHEHVYASTGEAHSYAGDL